MSNITKFSRVQIERNPNCRNIAIVAHTDDLKTFCVIGNPDNRELRNFTYFRSFDYPSAFYSGEANRIVKFLNNLISEKILTDTSQELTHVIQSVRARKGSGRAVRDLTREDKLPSLSLAWECNVLQ